MLVDVARRLAEPAEKLLTQSFRFAGWVVGRAAAPVFTAATPVFRLVRNTSRPVVRTLSAISPAALEKLWGLVPGQAAPATKLATPPKPRTPSRPTHIAVVPPVADAPTPAAAHAEADALLAGSERGAAALAHDELPVADWDGLTIAAIRQRTRALGSADILTLLAYERAHAARPAVILNLENRLAKLQHTNGAQPVEA